LIIFATIDLNPRSASVFATMNANNFAPQRCEQTSEVTCHPLLARVRSVVPTPDGCKDEGIAHQSTWPHTGCWHKRLIVSVAVLLSVSFPS
jgi:hypothetical protein